MCENILAKLKRADVLPMGESPVFDYYREMGVSWANDVERLKHWAATMRTVRTEIYWVTKANQPQALHQVAEGKGSKNILSPLKTGHGQLARATLTDTDIKSHGSEQKTDDWKSELFVDIEAGFSGSKCDIARTGTIMLESSSLEPRGLNLVPPVHLYPSDTSKMYDEFHDIVEGEKPVEGGMPTDAILIFGSSKTTGTQLILAYGARSSRDLAVLVVLSDHISPAALEEKA